MQGTQSISASSSCHDYLKLSEADRHDAAVRISSQLGVTDAGNPNWGLTLDAACGEDANRTLAEGFGQSHPASSRETPPQGSSSQASAALPACEENPFNQPVYPCSHPPYAEACYRLLSDGNTNTERTWAIYPLWRNTQGGYSTDLPEQKQDHFTASDTPSSSMANNNPDEPFSSTKDVFGEANSKGDRWLGQHGLKRNTLWGNGQASQLQGIFECADVTSS